MEGFSTYYGSVLSDSIIEEIDLNGIGKLLALTSNNEVNSLASMHFSKIFGSDNVYQLSFEENDENKDKKVSIDLRAQILFGSDLTFYKLLDKINSGMIIKSTKITEKFDYQTFIRQNGKDNVISLMVIDEERELSVFTNDNNPTPKEGDTLITLMQENKDKTI